MEWVARHSFIDRGAYNACGSSALSSPDASVKIIRLRRAPGIMASSSEVLEVLTALLETERFDLD